MNQILSGLPSGEPRRGMGLYSLIWSGLIVSVLGSGLVSFVLGVKVFQDTGSVTRFALIGLASALPSILFSPLAGVIADRFDRRLILTAANIGAALCNVLLYRLVSVETLEFGPIYLVVVAISAFGSFIWPTFAAATTLLVDKKDYGRASGMIQMGVSAAMVIAPFLAGLLLLKISLPQVVLINFASYLVPCIILLLVRFPQPEKSVEGKAASGTVRQQTGHAWRYVRQHPGLWRLLLTFAAVNFSLGFINVLITPLMLSFTSPQVLGVVLAVASSGTLVGGILMTVWGGPKRRILGILSVLLVSGLILMLGGLRANAALIAMAAFFFTLGFPVIAGCSQAIWQSRVPADFQGRVFAMRQVVVGSSLPLALAMAGPLADHVFEPLMAAGGGLAPILGPWIGIGPGRGIGLMLTVLGCSLLAAAIFGFRSRDLWRLEEEILAESDGAAEDAPPDALGEALSRCGRIPALALGLLVLVSGVGAILLQRPPKAPAVPEFSLERAFQHIETIAQQPHPFGSPAHAEVRRYLVDELESYGLETEVQSALSVLAQAPLFQLATVHNVLARWRGDEPGEKNAILLVAHYDSVPNGAGASDNATAVAALLETARVLSEGAPRRNDVIFLFTDAEEAFLHGARAFVGRHPWARDVAAVLNFDARGHGGPVFMFQTGIDNGWWMSHFIEGAPHPIASSLLNQIYQRLPNETDFTVFLEAGYAGFNFAFIEGLSHYHNELDEVGEVEPGSVLHHGSYALGMAQHLADVDLAAVPSAERQGPDRTYFNLLGSYLVHYPPWLAIASAALSGLLAVVFIGLGLRRGRLTPFGICQGFLGFLGILLVIPVGITSIWFIVRDISGIPVFLGSTLDAYRYMIAFAGLTAAFFLAIYRFLRRQATSLDLFAGVLLWWTILVIFTSGTVLPVDANFIFVWPLLSSLSAFGYLCLRPPGGLRPWPTVLILGITALPALLLLAPLGATSYVALQGLTQLGGAPLVFELLLLGLLIPHLEVLRVPQSRRLMAAVTAFSFVFLGLALGHHLSEQRLSQNTVVYTADLDSGEYSWFSFDREPDPWTRQFGFESGEKASFQHIFPWVPAPMLHHEAPEVDLPGPQVEVIEARWHGDQPEYHLRFKSNSPTRVRALWLEPSDATWVELGQAGIPIENVDSGRVTVIQRFPPEAQEDLILRLRGGRDATLHIVDQLEGLPAGLEIQPRPAGMMPRPGALTVRTDVTLVKRTIPLPPVTEPPVTELTHE